MFVCMNECMHLHVISIFLHRYNEGVKLIKGSMDVLRKAIDERDEVRSVSYFYCLLTYVYHLACYILPEHMPINTLPNALIADVVGFHTSLYMCDF